MPQIDTPHTMSVPAAGKLYFGLERGSSYRAAKRGEIPTIRIGRSMRVPVRAVEQMLDSIKPSAEQTA
jgi:excisionase family DNA binding protein